MTCDLTKENRSANRFMFETVVTDNQAGNLDFIKPTGILDIFQTAAGMHAEKLGVSMGELIKNGKCWVLESVNCECLKPICPHDFIRVQTRFADPERLFYVRDYLITDMAGNALVRGSSRWLVLDLKTRKPLTNEVEYGCSGAFKPAPHERIRKKFDSAEELGEYVVRRSDLDVVGHMNNTRYADVVFEFFPRSLDCLQIDYVKECRLGERLSVRAVCEDDLIFLEGRCEEERRFTARLKLSDGAK